jgi:hypothetical protein
MAAQVVSQELTLGKVEYVFRANDKPAEKRVIKFKGGKEAVDNIYQIFKRRSNTSCSYRPFLGADRLLPSNPVTGTYWNLKLAQPFHRGLHRWNWKLQNRGRSFIE